MQLQIVRDCQNELAGELGDYKDKYAEILDLLHDTQDQLKQQNKRNFPTAAAVPGGATATASAAASNSPRSSSYPPDSLASELELSSLGSDGWMSDFSACLVQPR